MPAQPSQREPERPAPRSRITFGPDHPTVTDFRGTKVRLYNSQRRLFRDRGFPQADFARVLARIRRGDLAGEVVRTSEEPIITVDESDRKVAIVVITCAPVAFIAFLVKYAATGKVDVVVLWMLAGMAAFFALMATLLWREFRRTFPTKARPKYVASAMLAEGRCPSCAARIDGTKPEEDKAIVCPNCGAAWNLARWESSFIMFDEAPY